MKCLYCPGVCSQWSPSDKTWPEVQVIMACRLVITRDNDDPCSQCAAKPQCVKTTRHPLDLGWGLLSQFPPFRYFPKFSALSKNTLTVKYRVYIWQVSPQLSCGDTCQIWMWFEKSNMYFCEIENFAYGEINERSFSNPHPWDEIVLT